MKPPTSRTCLALITAATAVAACAHHASVPVSTVTVSAAELESAPLLHAVPLVALHGDSGGEVADHVSLPREAALGPHGEAVIVASADSELVVFDSTGLAIRVVGRDGVARQFAVPVRATWAGADSLLVIDAAKHAIVVLDSSYHVIGTVTAGDSVRQLPLTLGADSSILVLARRETVFPVKMPAAVRVRFALVRLRGQRRADTVAEVAGDESYLMSSDPNREPAFYGFGRATVVAPWNGKLIIADNAGPALDVRDGYGKLVERIEVGLAPRLSTAAMRDTARAVERRRAQATVAPSEAVRNGWLIRIDSMRFADTLPSYASMVTGRDGSLWVERFVAPGDSVRTYLRFDQAGKLTGRLAMDTDFTLLAAGRDRILVHSVKEGSHDKSVLWALTVGESPPHP